MAVFTPRVFTPRNRTLIAAAAAAAALALAGCKGSDGGDTVTVAGDVPIAYVKRSVALGMNPTDGTNSAPGGDLLLREKSSASAAEINVTAGITLGLGDASDPEVSYDAKKIVFALRCPASNASTTVVDGATVPACTGAWNIWEYDMTAGLRNGTLRRITHSSQHDDVDPVYLPADGGFVFSSNRQVKSKTVTATGQEYFAVDEYERERVLNLHRMDKNGGNIEQISVNQSHDRNPVIRANGDIMFARWEHVGDRNRFAIFRAKPDGTDMFVLYGAHSPGNSFLHPREMDTRGPNRGYLLSSLMPLSGTQEGGGLMKIDAANYSEQGTPANSSVQAQGGQVQITQRAIALGRELSEAGRITTPYPLWDGTERVLLAFRPCEVMKNGVVTACVNLTDADRAMLNDNTLTRAQRAALPVQDNAPAAYGIYMYNPANQQFLPVASPPPGFMYTDPVAIQARPEPAAAQPTLLDAGLQARGMGQLAVRSVYDTDGLDRMGRSMMVDADLPAGCSSHFPTRAPLDAADPRSAVPDLVKMKDPADPAYRCSPAFFLRVTRAVAPQQGALGMREAIGETDFEPQQIVGYAPIEPDGSFVINVPADVALAIAVVDRQGRAFQTHLNWIQVRPGETRSCNGCHSPRRGASINSGTVASTVSSGWLASMAAAHRSGETMAATRTAADASLKELVENPSYNDVWADETKAGVVRRPAVALSYAGLQTPAPVNGLINYPDHIQPLWTRSRGANGADTCTGCHSDPLTLDLRANIAGTGRVTSYEELLVGDPLIDANGQPVTRLRDGVPELVREAPLVETGAGDGKGLARKSRLTEILFGETLLAGAEARAAHPTPTTRDHSQMLNAAEKRLLAEWMDLGGQYYNNPSASGSVRTVTSLNRAMFDTQVLPLLTANCASCHTAGGTSGASAPAPSFRGNRYVLTGSPTGDYNVTLTMISNACTPASNYLLSRPSTAPHPAGAIGQATPLLPVGSAGYDTIANWIRTGCPTP